MGCLNSGPIVVQMPRQVVVHHHHHHESESSFEEIPDDLTHLSKAHF